MSFQPNTYYRNGHPLNYNLTFQSIEDSDSRHLAIESHSIDITGGSLGQMTPQQVKESHRNKALSVHTSPSTETQFMDLIHKDKIYKIRQCERRLVKRLTQTTYRQIRN